MPSQRIRDLAGELNELISQVAIRDEPDDEADGQPLIPTVDDWLEIALGTYNMRRHREKVFGSPQLFGEPTWDILLDLFIGELRNRPMQTTSVCLGSQVPQTTALRWITLLEKEDLVRRYRDKTDSRRVYVQLTDRALRGMIQIFMERCFWLTARKRKGLPALFLGASGGGLRQNTEAIVAEAMAQITRGRTGAG
ncbi:winged helix DNA-binding protein [Novosphingobium album (ex Hu et al. 2023)]|uniref:Winged helix DNA-binding protein n=1 Tax=Novosphingobium album (ex Hu et al. 2023) TaxID=2930093 RepID=A0ABT0B5K3_9SPHN|nr:winged helix DNA-binding protein [Novosphingobium album (ex Hu et al. 2023)]MCJ2180325.1 winged helix DNA-binding protein [Novosphingobium album (ex Hu et al. 2023)]